MFILAEAESLDFCTQGMQQIIGVVGFALRLIQWVVPIILIVLGTIDLVRAVISGKDEDVKKHQTALLKRVIAAIIVFLIPLIVGVLLGFIGPDEWQSCWNQHQDDGINIGVTVPSE